MGKKEVKIDAIIEALNIDDYVDKFYNKATEYILDPNNKSSEYNGSRKYEKKLKRKMEKPIIKYLKRYSKNTLGVTSLVSFQKTNNLEKTNLLKIFSLKLHYSMLFTERP